MSAASKAYQQRVNRSTMRVAATHLRVSGAEVRQQLVQHVSSDTPARQWRGGRSLSSFTRAERFVYFFFFFKLFYGTHLLGGGAEGGVVAEELVEEVNGLSIGPGEHLCAHSGP